MSSDRIYLRQQGSGLRILCPSVSSFSSKHIWKKGPTKINYSSGREIGPKKRHWAVKENEKAKWKVIQCWRETGSRRRDGIQAWEQAPFSSPLPPNLPSQSPSPVNLTGLSMRPPQETTGGNNNSEKRLCLLNNHSPIPNAHKTKITKKVFFK